MSIAKLRAGSEEIRKFSPGAADSCDKITDMLEVIHQRLDENEQRRRSIAALDSFDGTMH
jgi:hypothetical protein